MSGVISQLQKWKIRFGFYSKPDFKALIQIRESEGKATPIIQLGLLGLATTLLAGLLVIATGARFAQRAFTIQFFLETSQRLIDGLTFFQSYFTQRNSPRSV